MSEASWPGDFITSKKFQEITLVNVSPPTTENKSKIRDKIKSESRFVCVCVSVFFGVFFF